MPTDGANYPELALLPNAKFFVSSQNWTLPIYSVAAPYNTAAWTSTYIDPAGPGGAHEEYDAADYQNMMLGGGRSVEGNRSRSGGKAANVLVTAGAPKPKASKPKAKPSKKSRSKRG